eukprot:6197227-Prymnesium_polylepis.2
MFVLVVADQPHGCGATHRCSAGAARPTSRGCKDALLLPSMCTYLRTCPLCPLVSGPCTAAGIRILICGVAVAPAQGSRSGWAASVRPPCSAGSGLPSGTSQRLDVLVVPKIMRR